MSSPRHSPPPSAAAPKLKGILKNADRRPSMGTQAITTPTGEYANSHLQWDETNLTLHEIEREQQEARMKIDEPKTPFVRGTSLGPVGDEDNFDLDSGAGLLGSAGPSTSYSLGRRNSAAEQLQANTNANAGLSAESAQSKPAVGRDAAELVKSAAGNNDAEVVQRSNSRGASRSPSFSLPKTLSRSSSSRSVPGGEGDQRDDLRQEMEERAMDVDDDGAVEEENPDPETQAKHAEFAAKRNKHYGNEAEAMKVAAALAAQEGDEDEDEDEDEEEEPASIPPVPPLPNGARK